MRASSIQMHRVKAEDAWVIRPPDKKMTMSAVCIPSITITMDLRMILRLIFCSSDFMILNCYVIFKDDVEGDDLPVD